MVALACLMLAQVDTLMVGQACLVLRQVCLTVLQVDILCMDLLVATQVLTDRRCGEAWELMVGTVGIQMAGNGVGGQVDLALIGLGTLVGRSGAWVCASGFFTKDPEWFLVQATLQISCKIVSGLYSDRGRRRTKTLQHLRAKACGDYGVC